jgi:hypothetical protein
MAQGFALGNILRVVPLDFTDLTNIPETNVDADGNFVDETGFFIRCEGEGYLTYCPMNNKSDAEAITKYFDSSYLFIDPELCRKIFIVTDLPQVSPAEAASGIYIGYGV